MKRHIYISILLVLTHCVGGHGLYAASSVMHILHALGHYAQNASDALYRSYNAQQPFMKIDTRALWMKIVACSIPTAFIAYKAHKSFSAHQARRLQKSAQDPLCTVPINSCFIEYSHESVTGPRASALSVDQEREARQRFQEIRFGIQCSTSHTYEEEPAGSKEYVILEHPGASFPPPRAHIVPTVVAPESAVIKGDALRLTYAPIAKQRKKKLRGWERLIRESRFDQAPSACNVEEQDKYEQAYAPTGFSWGERYKRVVEEGAPPEEQSFHKEEEGFIKLGAAAAISSDAIAQMKHKIYQYKAETLRITFSQDRRFDDVHIDGIMSFAAFTGDPDAFAILKEAIGNDLLQERSRSYIEHLRCQVSTGYEIFNQVASDSVFKPLCTATTYAQCLTYLWALWCQKTKRPIVDIAFVIVNCPQLSEWTKQLRKEKSVHHSHLAGVKTSTGKSLGMYRADVVADILPSNKQHLLWSDYQEPSATGPGWLFVKPESHGLSTITDFACHAVSFLRSQIQQSPFLSGMVPVTPYDHPMYAKERTPCQLVKLFKETMQAIDSTQDVSTLDKIGGQGIVKMREAIERYRKEHVQMDHCVVELLNDLEGLFTTFSHYVSGATVEESVSKVEMMRLGSEARFDGSKLKEFGHNPVLHLLPARDRLTNFPSVVQGLHRKQEFFFYNPITHSIMFVKKNKRGKRVRVKTLSQVSYQQLADRCKALDAVRDQ